MLDARPGSCSTRPPKEGTRAAVFPTVVAAPLGSNPRSWPCACWPSCRTMEKHHQRCRMCNLPRRTAVGPSSPRATKMAFGTMFCVQVGRMCALRGPQNSRSDLGTSREGDATPSGRHARRRYYRAGPVRTEINTQRMSPMRAELSRYRNLSWRASLECNAYHAPAWTPALHITASAGYRRASPGRPPSVSGDARTPAGVVASGWPAPCRRVWRGVIGLHGGR